MLHLIPFVKNFSTWITFSPLSVGKSSGLFTPSRRALAGRVGRMSGETVSPARVKMAERRLISSLLEAVAERLETFDTVAVVAGANAPDPAANKATENNDDRGDITVLNAILYYIMNYEPNDATRKIAEMMLR